VSVVRVPLGEPDSETDNSAYVLPDRGVVVDPGPPRESAWRRLRDGLQSAGLAPGDVDHILLTHWHSDHAGLLARLREESDATVAMHESDAPLVADYERERERRIERDARRMHGWGVPEPSISEVRAQDDPSPGVEGVPVDGVEDGERVAGVELVHTPGHTLGHAAYRVDDAILVGDAVLPAYTPNVGGGDTRQRDALGDTLATLRRLESLAPERVSPGHGGPLRLGPRIEAMRAHHDERNRRVFEAVGGGGDGTTPWEVATALFGELRDIHVKLGAGEAAAHLVHLEDRDAVERVGDDPVRYVRGDGDPGVPT
jgi:glyoxylase-like metal-dependent hydrolase (beta-lactamase superfamily II)